MGQIHASSVRTKSIDESVYGIRVSPDGSRRAIEWQPGNGTRYLVLAMRTSDLNNEIGRVGLGEPDDATSWIVSVQPLSDSACMMVDAASYLHWRYVAEKLARVSASDALALTEAICYLLRIDGSKLEDEL